MTFRTTAVFALTLAASTAMAQSVISARSGLVHYTEGSVAIDGEPLQTEFGRFTLLKNDAVISTENGYAEVLLAPGSFLRMGQDTSVKVISNSLEATRLEILSGTALIEVAQIAKEATIGVTVCGEETTIAKRGLYEFDADLSRVRVYDGKLSTDFAGESEELKKGRMVAFDGDPEVEKFKTKDRDDLYFWSKSRSEYLASANLGTATAARRGFITSPSWVWNSYLNTFTYLMASGTARSPFGYYWYSPATVWVVTQPRNVSSGWAAPSQDWGGISSRTASSVASAPVQSAPVRSAAPAAAPAAAVSGGRAR